MTGLRPHTKDYSQEARVALGVAFQRAREAAGYTSRPAFAKASGVGKTSLYKLESGIAVTAKVYEAAARAIPLWDEDTPVRVLKGQEAPPTEAIAAEARSSATAVTNGGLPAAWATEVVHDVLGRDLPDELMYFADRLKGNPDDLPRLLKLLELWHQTKLRVETPNGTQSDRGEMSR